MAVYAAHLTRTLQGTPSVFQVTAQEALGATVKPALRRLVEYLAAVYPDKCGWSERWYDELYLLLDCVVQYHYLKHYAASFSESFYGLVRAPISPSTEFSSGSRLPRALETGSWALLVAGPYIWDKLDQTMERWREAEEDGRLGKSKADRARKAALKLYSIAYFVTEASKLVVLARYLTGTSQAPTLPLHLLGITLRDAPPEEPDENTWGDFFKSILTGQFGNILLSLIAETRKHYSRSLVNHSKLVIHFHTLSVSNVDEPYERLFTSSAVLTFRMCCLAASAAAEQGAFLVQLLRWWDARAPAARAALPAPPPPQKVEGRWANICPLCLQPWRVPTVLPVSGYVFCYTCVSRALRVSPACPVSRLPAAERSLVRLYLEV